ncbi:MAG: M48 family metalloprotease [Proteobacteria bacterium]|nr:M48 family metalloprotease [Pseudomonadota bacterium]
MVRLLLGVVSAGISLAACAADVDGPPRCTDPKYGDGTCDLETSCAAPDIDCFRTFDTQAEAQTFYAAHQPAGRPAASAADPRFRKMHQLLLDGWAAYQATNDVGDLASAEPQLVLVDSDDVNAFVAAPVDTRVAFSVQVHTGLIDLMTSDDSVLGVVMHELAHGLKLHVFPEVKDRLRAYYVAAGDEPFGREQADDATARQAAETWLGVAREVNYFDDAELGGLPLGGLLGDLFYAELAEHASVNLATCQTPMTTVLDIRAAIAGTLDKLTSGTTLTANDTQAILTAMTNLRDQCFVNFTGGDPVHVLAQVYQLDEAAFRATLAPELRAKIDGKEFVSGLYNWVLYDRRRMRETEAAFQASTGQPWTQLRYFSTEEDADDTSVIVLAKAGLQADAISDVILKLQPGVEAPCRAALAGATAIPYGDRLTDDHHGDCWRADHAARFEIHVASAAPRTIDDHGRLIPIRLGPATTLQAPPTLSPAALAARVKQLRSRD